MAKKLDHKETVTVEELVLAQAYEMAALVELLEEKGILTRADVLERVKRLRLTAGRAARVTHDRPVKSRRRASEAALEPPSPAETPPPRNP